MFCPICKSTMVGKIGQDRYFCRNCFYEFKMNDGFMQTFEINEDGSFVEVVGK